MTRPLPRPVRVYRVGGSVRDELLGRAEGDRDFVVVGATPEMMLASGYMPVGKDFPVFLHPETRDEYALARTERKSGRGYRGFRFFATPDVTLEDDLRRRDLTINAMARSPDGALIDPYGGEADLRAGVLRHVSTAFAEDPLRVLRVARFAARLGFRIDDATSGLMRDIAASGELATLAPERVWQELARGLCEAHPSRLLAALRDCGALAALLPEIDALYAIRAPTGELADDTAGTRTERALDWAAAHAVALPGRYATLAQELDHARAGNRRGAGRSVRAALARVEAMSTRLKVPVDCRDAARLAVRWHDAVATADRLAPAAMLDLLVAADALRRPERLDAVIASTAAHEAAERCREQDVHCASSPAASPLPLPPAGESRGEGGRSSGPLLREALAVVRNVDAAAIARDAIERASGKENEGAALRGAAVATALRAARLAALRAWKKDRQTR